MGLVVRSRRGTIAAVRLSTFSIRRDRGFPHESGNSISASTGCTACVLRLGSARRRMAVRVRTRMCPAQRLSARPIVLQGPQRTASRGRARQAQEGARVGSAPLSTCAAARPRRPEAQCSPCMSLSVRHTPPGFILPWSEASVADTRGTRTAQYKSTCRRFVSLFLAAGTSGSAPFHRVVEAIITSAVCAWRSTVLGGEFGVPLVGVMSCWTVRARRGPAAVLNAANASISRRSRR